MTVAEFFSKTVGPDGRAVVRGYDYEPVVWLTRPARYENTYCLCHANRDSIRWLSGEEPSERINHYFPPTGY